MGLLAIHERRHVATEAGLDAEAVVRLGCLVDQPALCILSRWVSLNATLVGLVEGLGSDPLGRMLGPHRLRLLQDPLEAVNQVLVVLVAVEHVEAGQYELVLLLNEPVEELDVLFVSKVVVSQAIDEQEELLLVLWDRRHGSLHKGPELLREPGQLRAELLLIDGSGDVAVDLSEHVHVLLQDQRLKEAGHLLVQ